MKKIKVGIIGCGTIGQEIARSCVGVDLSDKVELLAVCDVDQSKIDALKKELNKKIAALTLDGLIKRVDLVIEAASAEISAEVMEKAIKNGKDIMVMSVGGLLGHEKLLDEAKERGIKVYIPSGAICGIDGLKAASVGKIESVTLTTKKPPKGLEGAPYLVARNINLKDIKEETAVFEGTAEEAAKGFPKNINVCAVLSLAGLGAKNTLVRIVTSPDFKKNIHELEIIGDAGRITTKTENVPSKANPRTSALAILSAIATLEGITSDVRIGT